MVEKGEYRFVGVNVNVDQSRSSVPILKIDPDIERARIEKVKAFKDSRKVVDVNREKEKVSDACKSGQNVIPSLIDGVKKGLTLGEISDIYRNVFGVFRDDGSI